jgi:AcrR family transcriptional regulator
MTDLGTVCCDVVSQSGLCHDCDTVSTPTIRSPRVPAAEARRRILDATERLLAGGARYRDLSVDGVMTAAGLARTVFYRHFDGLPAVVLALLDEVGAELAAIVDDPGADLEQVIGGVVAVYAEHGPLMRAVDEAAGQDDAVEAAYRAVFAGHVERTVAVLGPGLRDVALALHAMNRAYLIETLGREPSGDPAAVAAALVTVWQRTLAAGC